MTQPDLARLRELASSPTWTTQISTDGGRTWQWAPGASAEAGELCVGVITLLNLIDSQRDEIERLRNELKELKRLGN